MAPPGTSSASAVDEMAASPIDLGPVDQVLEEHNHDSTELIAILLDTQEALGYLPIQALRHISVQLDFPITEIYGIATFYKHFRLEPPARHTFTICTGTACHVRGAVQVLREFERRLGIDITRQNTTEDGMYGLETVNCVGACALGPVVIVDGEFKGQIKPTKVAGMIRRIERAEGGE